MDKNYSITKSNYFIMNANYDLTLEEQKVVLTLASVVQPEDEDFKSYIFKISDFIEILGIENQSKYTDISKITKGLLKKVFEIKEGETIVQTAWLSGAKYYNGEGIVELQFSSFLKPYMIKLSNLFTQYKLSNILNMKSKYSPRVYELLKCNEFKKQAFIEIEIEELRKLFKLENIYPLYADFKKYILIKSQKEINNLTDISFDFKEIKRGRKVTSLKFNIKPNKSKKELEEKVVTAAEKEISKTIEKEKIEVGLIENIAELRSFISEPLTNKELTLILKVAKNNILIIREKYIIAEQQGGIKNIVAWLCKAIIEDYKPIQGKEKYSTFNDFEQREYDPEFENKILNWYNTQ